MMKNTRLNTSVFVAVLLCCIVLSAAAQTSAQTPQKQSPLDGRWDVSFDTASGEWFGETLAIDVTDSGAATVTMLGRSAIKFADGRADKNKLTVEGSSQRMGAIKFSAIVSGDVLEGEWKTAAGEGRVRGTRRKSSGSADSYAATFDAVWGTINKMFYDPKFNGADWKGAAARYRPRAAAARSDRELVGIVREMLAELRSSHVEFYLAPQKSSSAASAQNAPAPIVWRELSPETGYIQIKRFSPNSEHLKLVDDAFAELGSLESIVIDLRDNPGGALGIGMRLGDYLFKSPQPVGYFATRGGLARFKTQSMDGLKSSELPTFAGYETSDFARELGKSGALMLVTGGKAAKTYGGRVVVLTNNRSGSGAEAVASIFKETGRATLVGQRTAGAMLNGTEIPVGNGWTLVVPIADFRTPGGVRVEAKGVEPNIPVESGISPNAVLEIAVKHLQGNGKQSENGGAKTSAGIALQPEQNEKWQIWRNEFGFDVRALLTESEAHSTAMHGSLIADYSFVQKETYRITDKNGQIKKEKFKTYEIYPLPGRISVQIQTGENGVPFSSEKVGKEREKASKKLERIEREQNKNAAPGDAAPKENKQWISLRISSEKMHGSGFWINPRYFLRAGAIYAARRENFHGRETLVAEFRPKTSFTPTEKGDEVAAKLAGKIWVDIAEKVIVRVEAFPAGEAERETTANGKLNSPDANAPVIVYEQMRLPDGLWAPKMMLFDSSRNKNLFDGIDMNNLLEFSDYKRSYVEVREKIGG
ncbi:MAG TPA: S41 family peptidase [Pyrinomonadaceae bacterium]|jgi:hypothetical protein